MTSYGPLTSSIMWPFEAAYVTSYRSSIETKPVSPLVFEIFSFENFYVMTSPLTSRCLDRLSVWIVWTHCAVDGYVKIWYNFCKNWQRLSILNGVTSLLWRHRVTWRHRWGHHLIAPDHFPSDTLSSLVSEIFDLHGQTNTQTHRRPRELTIRIA